MLLKLSSKLDKIAQRYLLTQAALTEVKNWSLCFMSAWMVGKMDALKANMMVAKALKIPSADGLG